MLVMFENNDKFEALVKWTAIDMGLPTLTPEEIGWDDCWAYEPPGIKNGRLSIYPVLPRPSSILGITFEGEDLEVPERDPVQYSTDPLISLLRRHSNELNPLTNTTALAVRGWQSFPDPGQSQYLVDVWRDLFTQKINSFGLATSVENDAGEKFARSIVDEKHGRFVLHADNYQEERHDALSYMCAIGQSDYMWLVKMRSDVVTVEDALKETPLDIQEDLGIAIPVDESEEVIVEAIKSQSFTKKRRVGV